MAKGSSRSKSWRRRANSDRGSTHQDVKARIEHLEARVAGGPPQDCRDWWKTKTIQNSVAPQWDAEFTQALAAPELCVVVLECWDDDTVTGDDFLGTVAVPLAEVTAGKQLDLPLLAATLAPWPRKHGAPSLQVTFDMVYADNVRSA